MVKRTILVALALLSLAASAFAQEDTESAFATIFRGKLPATYPYRHNGTYYWDRKEFQQGDVWYNGRLYRDIFLNVDAVSGELQARPVEWPGSRWARSPSSISDIWAGRRRRKGISRWSATEKRRCCAACRKPCARTATVRPMPSATKIPITTIRSTTISDSRKLSSPWSRGD